MSGETSIYERIGGQEAIDGLVDKFYAKITSDSVLQSYFKHAPVGKIMEMQRQFLSAATGGPLTYAGRPLREVHQHLGISRYEFDRYVRILTETLAEMGLSEEDQRQVAASINIYADDITNDVKY